MIYLYISRNLQVQNDRIYGLNIMKKKEKSYPIALASIILLLYIIITSFTQSITTAQSAFPIKQYCIHQRHYQQQCFGN